MGDWVVPVGAHAGKTELDRQLGPLRPRGLGSSAFLSEAPKEFKAAAKVEPLDDVMMSAAKPNKLSKPTVASASLARFRESRRAVRDHLLGGYAQHMDDQQGLRIASTALSEKNVENLYGGELLIDFKHGASYDNGLTETLSALGAKWAKGGAPNAISLYGDIPLSALKALKDQNIHSIHFRGSKDLMSTKPEAVATAIPGHTHVLQFDMHTAVGHDINDEIHKHVAAVLTNMTQDEKYPRAVVLHHPLGDKLHGFYDMFNRSDVALVLHQPVGMTTAHYKEARKNVELLDVKQPVTLLQSTNPQVARYEPVPYDPTYWTNAKHAGILDDNAPFITPDQGLANQASYSA